MAEQKTNEIILFCGNPGVGKSSLCNSIFNKQYFKSGYSKDGTGITIKHQEYVYENRKYIDTPGLSDYKKRIEAANEIECALKKNNNYKIIFVVTLEAGRFRPDDFETVRCVCDAVKTKFDYGIIINKATKNIIETSKNIIENLNEFLNKANIKIASEIIFIKKEFFGEDNDDPDNVLLTNNENKTKLVNFISQLNANMIYANNIQNIDIRNYEQKVRDMETKLLDALNKIQDERKKAEDERIKYQKLMDKQNQENERLKKQIQEADYFNKWYYIISSHNGLVLDVYGAKKENCVNLIVYPKHGGYNQQFKINKDGSIVVRHSSKVLDCEGGLGDNRNIIQYDFHNGQNQKFTLDGCTTSGYGYIRIGNCCLDIYGGGGSGTKIISYNLHGGSNQKWKLEEV